MEENPHYSHDRAVEMLKRAYAAKDKALTENSPERVNEYWRKEALDHANEALATAIHVRDSNFFAPNSKEGIKMTNVIEQSMHFEDKHLPRSMTAEEMATKAEHLKLHKYIFGKH